MMNREFKGKYSNLIERLDFHVNKEYDRFSMDRIMALFKLRDFLSISLSRQEFVEPCNSDGKTYRGISLYAAMLHSVDLLIYNFINDESLVVINGRSPVNLTMGVCVSELVESGYNFPNNNKSILEIQNLYVNRNDEMIGSMLLDFSVSTFSAFEYFISKIYYSKVNAETIEAHNRKFHKNIPANLMIDTVLGLIKGDEKLTKAELKDFRDCIDIHRRIRNTVHTLGIYTKKETLKYTIESCSVFLEFNKSVYTDSHQFNILLCEKMTRIYMKVCVLLGVKQIEYVECENTGRI
ncbi:hypothetical protein [Dryocola sp. BD626]|uniref:hypothetical protein n=1 Tax=Dryocola sp. BD626 TaxID=3133273 RepID=UPI003F4F409E